jgi:outer membrane protein assembly factor BamB
MSKFLCPFILIFFVCSNSFAQEFSEWRGKGRTGVYDETGLLKEWPVDGPKMIWFNDSIPDGYSSVSIANNMIYLTGLVDTMDVLVALDMQGKELWQTPYGLAWDASYQNSRATPTVENDRVFLSSGKGEVACLDAKSGEIVWKYEASKVHKGTFPRFGLSESVLIDEKRVFFTPGGNQTTMIALDKNTGKLLWESKSLRDNPSFCSPLMIEENGKKLIVNVIENYIFGILPEDGKIVWTYDFGQYKKGRNNNTNTPIYYNKGLFVTSGYDHSSVKLKLSDDLSKASLAWIDTVLDIHHGGVVKIGNYLYGANWEHNRMGHWVCLNWETGKAQYETEWKNKGSIIAADGMLYCFEEKTGYLALVEVDPKEFKVISSFKIPKGTGPYWAHPVINNGVLYIRHGKALMAFDIKK